MKSPTGSLSASPASPTTCGLPGFGVVDMSPEGLQQKLVELTAGLPGAAEAGPMPLSPVQLLVVGL